LIPADRRLWTVGLVLIELDLPLAVGDFSPYSYFFL